MEIIQLPSGVRSFDFGGIERFCLSQPAAG